MEGREDNSKEKLWGLGFRVPIARALNHRTHIPDHRCQVYNESGYIKEVENWLRKTMFAVYSTSKILRDYPTRCWPQVPSHVVSLAKEYIHVSPRLPTADRPPELPRLGVADACWICWLSEKLPSEEMSEMTGEKRRDGL